MEYFSEDSSVVVAFWSAKLETERLDSMSKTTNEPESGSILDLGLGVEQRSVGAPERSAGMATDNAMEIVTMETTCSTRNTPTADTAFAGSECVHIVETTPTLDVEHIDEKMCGVEATPAVESCAVEEEDEGRAALLSGEQLLELLVRVSPVAPGALTTVGMVRRGTHTHHTLAISVVSSPWRWCWLAMLIYTLLCCLHGDGAGGLS